MGLFGCSKGEELSESEWNERLKDALEKLDFVRDLSDVTYTRVGMFLSQAAWISGWIVVDAADEAEVRRCLDVVGRTIVEVHRTNFVSDSSIRIKVARENHDAQTFQDVLGMTSVTLEDLAEHYGIPRH